MIQWIVFPWENPSEGFSRTPPGRRSTCRGGSREFPILRYGQVPAIVRFVLMPDGHLLSAEQKVGKDSPKRTHGSLGELSFRGDCDSPRAPTFDGRSPP